MILKIEACSFEPTFSMYFGHAKFFSLSRLQYKYFIPHSLLKQQTTLLNKKHITMTKILNTGDTSLTARTLYRGYEYYVMLLFIISTSTMYYTMCHYYYLLVRTMYSYYFCTTITTDQTKHEFKTKSFINTQNLQALKIC